MKAILYILLVCFTCPNNLFGQNCSPQSILDEYEAGQRTINEIITKNNIGQMLDGYAYAGFFFGRSWLIVKKGDVAFEMIVGSKDNGISNTYSIDLKNKVLTSLFAWTNHAGPIIYTIKGTQHTSLYYYYILFDKNHIKKMEFNLQTMAAYKNAQEKKRDRKMLPFTKEQFEFIWELLNAGVQNGTAGNCNKQG